jgi:hypothetical protein
MSIKLKNPVIEKVLENGKVIIIKFGDGLRYRLQHPGNRDYLQWQKEHYSMTAGFDQEAMLDKFFEYCVIPEDHDKKPELDNILPTEVTAWSTLMHKFLSGDVQLVIEKSAGKKNQKSGMEAEQ